VSFFIVPHPAPQWLPCAAQAFAASLMVIVHVAGANIDPAQFPADFRELLHCAA
jgi:hypothetical protein